MHQVKLPLVLPKPWMVVSKKVHWLFKTKAGRRYWTAMTLCLVITTKCLRVVPSLPTTIAAARMMTEIPRKTNYICIKIPKCCKMNLRS